jgi:hypothetical protein
MFQANCWKYLCNSQRLLNSLGRPRLNRSLYVIECSLIDLTSLWARAIHSRNFGNGLWVESVLIVSRTVSHCTGSCRCTYIEYTVVMSVCQQGRNSEHGQLAGSLFNFPATSVPSTFLRALRRLMSGVEFLSVPGLRATSQNILWSTSKVNEACVRPPHVAWQKLDYQTIAHTEL